MSYLFQLVLVYYNKKDVSSKNNFKMFIEIYMNCLKKTPSMVQFAIYFVIDFKHIEGEGYGF